MGLGKEEPIDYRVASPKTRSKPRRSTYLCDMEQRGDPYDKTYNLSMPL
jgi:hypothetical protein